jgi:hypothetical protein
MDIPIKNPEIKLNPSFDGKNLSIIKAMARAINPMGIASL